MQEISEKFHLSETDNFQKFMVEWKIRQESIPETFYSTTAMTTDEWKMPVQKLRHVVTRLVVNGFHHLICKPTGFHEVTDICVCSLCDQQAHMRITVLLFKQKYLLVRSLN